MFQVIGMLQKNRGKPPAAKGAGLLQGGRAFAAVRPPHGQRVKPAPTNDEDCKYGQGRCPDSQEDCGRDARDGDGELTDNPATFLAVAVAPRPAHQAQLMSGPGAEGGPNASRGPRSFDVIVCGETPVMMPDA